MHRALLLILCIGFGPVSWPQSTSGITGIPDTSYSNASAYRSSLKHYPGISLVAEIHDTAIAVQKDIIYCNPGNRELHLDLFYPKKKEQRNGAAVIIVHGGGWRSGNRTQHYPLAERLAVLGYVCYTPEYRLSTEALYPAAVYDVKSAIKWVRANSATYGIDTSKICVLGFSAGGELAAFMGSTNNLSRFDGNRSCNNGISPVVNAVVDLDGILAFIHPESGEGDDSRGTSAATYWFGYSKSENPELWKDGSSLTHVDAHAAPILFLNSSVSRMHAGREDYIRVLNQHGIYSEVHTFNDAPHSFPLFEPWFSPTVTYIDGFLKKVFALQQTTSQ